MNQKTLAYRITPLLALAFLACGWLRTAEGQVDKSVPEEKSASPKSAAIAEVPAKVRGNVADPSRLAFYYLKHADWQTAQAVLGKFVASDDEWFLFDARTNGLIVFASPETQRKVNDLLQKLDNAPSSSEAEQSIKVFSLVYADPASAARMLSTIGSKHLRVSIDERTRSLIAAGPPDDLNVAEALLTKLDQGTTGIARYEFEVRVIWLASGLTGEAKGELFAEDLKDVVAELSRLGIKDPRQIGQMVVRTTVGGSKGGMFEVKSSPHFGDQMAEFNASGSLSLLHNRPGLATQIRLRTKKVPSPPEQYLNEIETQIVMPEKQYVVLATAPTGNQTSAFVVQVTEATNPAEKKGKR